MTEPKWDSTEPLPGEVDKDFARCLNKQIWEFYRTHSRGGDSDINRHGIEVMSPFMSCRSIIRQEAVIQDMRQTLAMMNDQSQKMMTVLDGMNAESKEMKVLTGRMCLMTVAILLATIVQVGLALFVFFRP